MVNLSNKTKKRFITAMAREEEALEILATIESGGGVPDGGTAGQVLAKLSSTDGDATWQDLSGVSVSSVNGYTGPVVLNKTDIGLSDVNNTSDANKPISDATQSALDDKQALITGSNLRPIYKDSSGVVKSLEEVTVGITTGWEQLDLIRNMNGVASSFDIYRNNLNINALQSSPDETWHMFQNQVGFDTSSSGFNMGTTGTAFRFHINNIYHSGTSDMGSIEFTQNNFNIGNGTDPIDVKGFGYMFGFGQFNANVNISAPIQGYGFQPFVNASATISPTTYIQAFYDAVNIQCEAPTYNSFNASPQIASIANNNNFHGLNINPTIGGFAGNAGGNGVGIYGNWGTFGTSGGFKGLNISPTAANVHYADGINVSMDNVSVYPGVASSLVIQDLTITFQTVGDNNTYQVEYVDDVLAGSETASLSGQLITVHMESGVSTALQIRTAIQANVSLNSNLTITISGIGSNTQVSQAPTNFVGGINAGYKRAAYLDGDVEITGALTFGGALSIGKLNAFGSQALVDGGGTPSSVHSLITQPTVAANVTVANADLIAVNTAMLLNIGDNATVTTSFIGVSALGLPAVITMGSGSTLDRASGATFALSLDAASTGGTIDEVALCKAIAIPNGTTTVNNLYGYLFDLPFGDPGTSTWGFYSRTTNHNYFGGDLLIGGTAGSDDIVSNNSVALEIKSTTKAFMNARMTTTERNALTAVNGMQIYNSTTDKLQVYAGGSWVDLH